MSGLVVLSRTIAPLRELLSMADLAEDLLTPVIEQDFPAIAPD